MIRGIGIDLIEVKRIEKAMAREGFLERYFTEREIELFQKHKMNPQKVAGNFATKEAVVKMMGTGFRKVRLIDIEVLRDVFGKPEVILHDAALVLSGDLKLDYIHVSISNTESMVTAVAVGERISI